MSLKATTWAFRQKLPPTTKLVLLALADHSDDHGKCWPGVARIAEKTGLDRRSVQRRIRDLEHIGFIRTQQRLDESGRRMSSTYALNMGGRHSDAVRASERRPRWRQADAPEGVTVTPESTIGNVNPSSPDGEDVRGDAAYQHRTSQSKAKNNTPPCPHAQIIALYHELLPMCPAVKEWNKTREGLLRSRWRDDPKRQSLDWWREFFVYVAGSKFLTGQAEPRVGKPPFVADLEWLVRPGNFAKVIEGRYHNRRAA